jgi:hypothetical protein
MKQAARFDTRRLMVDLKPNIDIERSISFWGRPMSRIEFQA